MNRMLTLTLSLLLALSLSACKAKEETPPPAASAPAASVQTPQKEPDKLPVLQEFTAVSYDGETMKGRLPGGEYTLPSQPSDMTEWMMLGGVSLLTELKEADAAFYAVEGKEFSPALLRWGDALVEFDWAYATPRAIPPRLWCFDIDGDGAEELVVDCYVASGTGVSMSDLHVVEKNEDGTLTDHSFPAGLLNNAIKSGLQLYEQAGKTYAALGKTTVEITKALEGTELEYRNSGLTLGSLRSFELGEEGMKYILGAVVDTKDVPLYYVAEITADVLYEDGKFTLDGFRLESYY